MNIRGVRHESIERQISELYVWTIRTGHFWKMHHYFRACGDADRRMDFQFQAFPSIVATYFLFVL